MSGCGLWFHGQWCAWTFENISLSVAVLGVFLIFRILRSR